MLQVVLTTVSVSFFLPRLNSRSNPQIWVELVNDPKLFARTHVKSRDHKAGAILMLFIGGLVARCIIDTIGSPATLGIGAVMRVLGAVWWVFAS